MKMKARFLWRAYKARFRDQVAEMGVLRRALRPTDVVCDIGANKGSYLYWLSRWVPGGRVIAFEPQESLAAYLRTVAESFQLTNVTVEHKAVSAQRGRVELFVPGGGVSPGASLHLNEADRARAKKTEVESITLDAYFESGVRLAALKIDVEGAELGVFAGAQRILSEQAPVLVFECENRHLPSGSVYDVFKFLTGLGYQGQFIQGRHLKPLSEFDPAIHQKQNGKRFWDAKDYYNNFVFRKR